MRKPTKPASRGADVDPFGALALTVTLSGAALYALYWVVRRAVADGIRDARGASGDEPAADRMLE